MRFISKILASAALLLAAFGAQAQVYGNTNTYSNLAWGFTSSVSGFNTCSTLFIDATGDFSNSDDYAVYGQLVCSGGSYLVNGNARFDSGGNFNMMVDLGVANKLFCSGLSGSTLSGNCTIYNSSGGNAGTAFLNFL